MAGNSQVQEIKDRLNIVEVVSQYVKLTKAGKNYKGLSPFKKERTPSFMVSPERNSYYCFSTQKGGDAFSFIQEMEGVDFRGALKILADKAGVKLTQENPEARKRADRLHEVMEAAAKYFEEEFVKYPEAEKYLNGRGLLTKTIHEWRVGYAPSDWRPMRTHLQKLGFTDDEMLRGGLTKKPDAEGKGKEPYDRFRGRILFPITDTSERVVAFSGRLFPDDGSGKAPKYLNSPETELFEKGKILYGYTRAKSAIRKYNFSILVEGQMDLVMSHQGGFPNTVAASGTGLTDDHLTLLSRISNNIVMAFDADSAGVASAMRGTALALRRGMDVKIARVPSGKDPADAVKEDPNLWKQAVRESKHVVDFQLALLAEQGLDARTRELRVREAVLPFIKNIQSAIDQAHFVSKVAGFLGIREEAVWDELSKISATALPEMPKEESASVPLRPAQSQREKLERLIAAMLYLEAPKTTPAFDRELVTTRFGDIVGDEAVANLIALRAEDQESLFEAEQVLADSHPEDLIEHALDRLSGEIVRDQLRRIEQQVRDAEMLGKHSEVETLLREQQELSKRLAKGSKV